MRFGAFDRNGTKPGDSALLLHEVNSLVDVIYYSLSALALEDDEARDRDRGAPEPH